MNASNDREAEAIERLVAEYLKAEATTVDGRALLDRALETRRRHLTWRRVAIVFAAAAAVILVVTLGLMATPEPPGQPDIPQVIRPVTEGAGTLGDSFGTVHASLLAIRQSVEELHSPVISPTTANLQPIAAEFKTTLRDDASYMGGKLRTSISIVVTRAGLAL